MAVLLTFGPNLKVPAEVLALGKELEAIYKQLYEKIFAVKKMFEDIDPNAPNALELYERANAEREAFNAGIDGRDKVRLALVDRVLAAANTIKDSDMKRDFLHVVDSFGDYYKENVAGTVKPVREAKLAAINEAIKAKEAAAAAAPPKEAQNQTNDDKTTGATAGANQTPPASLPANNPNPPNTGSTTVNPDTPKPGRRLFNPLSKFASYTYQITWYMITPDAYDAFIKSGRRDINALKTASNGQSSTGGGAFIIAQSGGVNDSTTQRAPGMNFDYYIDNLKITTNTSTKSAGGEVFFTQMSFQVTEPYGFSLVSNLKRAGDELAKRMKNIGKEIENPLRQFFMLGVRFYGYDANGNLITGKETLDNGELLDPEGNSDGIFERFFDIGIESFKFKVDGKQTVYDITATSWSPQASFGTKKGVIDQGATVQAKTVRQALVGPNGVLTRLNKLQEDLAKKGSIKEATKYSVKFLGDAETEIADATIVLPSDLDKWKWAGAPVTSTTQSTELESVKAVPNSQERIMVFKSGTTVMSAVNRVIAQSSYLEEALKTVYSTQPPDPKKKDRLVVKPKRPNTISWYNLSSQVTNARWDPKTGDWAYDIEYVIQPYLTPVIQSAYANPGTPYYGPHKRYDYWYTGKNNEILSYSQNFDCTFFTVALEPATGGEQASSAQGAPSVANKRTNAPRLGKLDTGMEAQNTYITSLNDPGSLTDVKITILGDPDYLMTDSPTGESSIYNQFYANDNFTINANGGQVYIEIDFKEAIDYKNSLGIMAINESILFWKYPESISKKIKGVAYQVLEVQHSFSGGKFQQTIGASIVTFPEEAAADEAAKTSQSTSTGNNDRPNDRAGAAGASSGTGNSGSSVTPASQSANPANPASNSGPAGGAGGSNLTTPSQGLRVDEPIQSTGKNSVNTNVTAAPTFSLNDKVVLTPTGIVKDDDAAAQPQNTNIDKSGYATGSRLVDTVGNITVGNVTQPRDPVIAGLTNIPNLSATSGNLNRSTGNSSISTISVANPLGRGNG